MNLLGLRYTKILVLCLWSLWRNYPICSEPLLPLENPLCEKGRALCLVVGLTLISAQTRCSSMSMHLTLQKTMHYSSGNFSVLCEDVLYFPIPPLFNRESFQKNFPSVLLMKPLIRNNLLQIHTLNSQIRKKERNSEQLSTLRKWGEMKGPQARWGNALWEDLWDKWRHQPKEKRAVNEQTSDWR